MSEKSLRGEAQTPPPASETLDVEKLQGLLIGLAAHLVSESRVYKTMVGIPLDVCDAALRSHAAALPSLLRAQTDVEMMTSLLSLSRQAIGHTNAALSQAQTRVAELETELETKDQALFEAIRDGDDEAQLRRVAQTERDALQYQLNEQIRDKHRILGEYEAELSKSRAQVSALEAAQRETVAKVEALPARSSSSIADDVRHVGESTQPEWFSRRSVLDILAPVLHTTPTQP